MIKSRKNRNIIIGGLLVAILIMVVGYAALASNLQINGTANVSSTWDVEILSVTPDKTATNSGTQQSPNYTTPGDISHSITGNNLTANFDTALVKPGDTVTYTIVVKNKGTIDAMLNNVTKTDANNPAITFTVNGLSQGERLNAGASKTFTVVVGYSSSVTSQPASTDSTLAVTLNYTQYDPSNAPTVAYSISEYSVQIGQYTVGTPAAWCIVGDGFNSCTDNNYGLPSQDACLAEIEGAPEGVSVSCTQGTINIDSEDVANIGTTYNNCAATGKNVCLRHTIQNNRITGSDVCFIKGGVEYCLTGGDGGTSYNTNVSTLQTAFTETNACTDYGSNLECRTLEIIGNVFSSGRVDVYGVNWDCQIISDGSSRCEASGGDM